MSTQDPPVHTEEKAKHGSVSLKIPPSLNRELLAICEVEGRVYLSLKQYFLEIAIKIAKGQQEFRLTPHQFFLHEQVGESEKVPMEPEAKEWLEGYAEAESLSLSELVCQLLLFVCEYHRRLMGPGRILRKEEFIARIAEDLSRRWAKNL